MGKLFAPLVTKVAACGMAGFSALTGAIAAYGRKPPVVPMMLILVLAFLGSVAFVVKEVWCTKLREEGRTKRLAIEYAGIKEQREAKARMCDAVHATADVSADQDRIAEAKDARRNTARVLESRVLGEIEARPRPGPRVEAPTSGAAPSLSPRPAPPAPAEVTAVEHGGDLDDCPAHFGSAFGGADDVEPK